MGVTRKIIKFNLLFLFIIWLILISSGTVNALSISEVETTDFNYNDIQEVIDGVLTSKERLGFEDYVMDLFNGSRKISLQTIIEDIKNGVLSEIKANIGVLTSLISIVIIAAVFSNFSNAFQNSQVAETGFYVTYLLLFSVLTVSFIAASSIATNTLNNVLDFMKALVPTYFMAVAFSSSAGTSLVYYQASLFLITAVDMLLIKLIIPIINIYLIISMANNLSKEDLLSKLCELLSTIVKWMLKTLLAVVIGFHSIQGLILPVADSVKRSTLIKVAGIIPGVGDVLGSVTESVLGAGMLLKNAIGIAGVIVIVIICAVPLIKLVVVSIIYRLSSALVQPISDKRMLNCVTSTAQAAELLLQTVLVGSALFLITVTIVASTTTR